MKYFDIRHLGLTALLSLACIQVAWAMEFRAVMGASENLSRQFIDGGQPLIFASGDINATSVAKFEQLVKSRGIEDALVLFDSNGGSLVESLKLGMAIREHNFNTGIARYGKGGQQAPGAICASACVYAFAGGQYRYFDGKKGKLGLHQFYTDGNNRGDLGSTQVVSSILLSYLQTMGVATQAFIMASTTPGNEMHWLSLKQTLALNLVNNGWQPTTAEIKLASGYPYLKLEQQGREGTAKLLFHCYQNEVGSIMAGIVTTAELSSQIEPSIRRSYLETEKGKKLFMSDGELSVRAVRDTLWLLPGRPSDKNLLAIAEAEELGFWVEGGGAFRWGMLIDLRPVKTNYINFLKQCLG